MSLTNSLMFKAGLDMRPAERALIEFRGKADTITRSLGQLRGAAFGIGATLTAGFAAGAMALKQAMDAGAEMETFESRLTTLMGSATEARARMGELFEFAATTPFELSQVVGAEATLRGFGAAAEELMPGLIDFSAVVGSDLSQSAIDFGKAWNQGATGLESDTARILRRQIEIRTGVNATSLSLEEFRAAMLDTLDNGMFAGGADKLSQTFGGMVSNLQDEWSRFKLEVSDAGLFNNVKGALSIVLDLIGQNRESTKMWAGIVAEQLWSAVKTVAGGIALTVDGVTALGSAFLIVKANALDLGGVLLKVGIAVNEVELAAARMVGADGLVDVLTRAQAFGKATAAAFSEDAEATRALVNSLGETGTALTMVENFFGRAEDAAKNYGTTAEDAMARAAETAAGGIAGPTKKDTAETDDLLQRFEAAQSFTDSMLSMGRTQVQEEQALYAERMALLLDYHDQGLITGQLFTDTRIAIEREYSDTINAMRDEEAEKQRARERDQLTATAGLFGAVAQLAGTASDAMGESQKKAALTMFKIQKGSALVQAGINAFLATSQAAASAPPPFNAIPIAAAAVQSAAIIAGIAAQPAPTFAHQGRAGTTYAHQGRGPAPDERDLRVLASESTLNSQATRALGQQGVEAMNSGRSPSTNVTLNIGRTQQREVFRDELRSGMGPLRNYVTDLLNDNGTPGFSGALAAA